MVRGRSSGWVVAIMKTMWSGRFLERFEQRETLKAASVIWVRLVEDVDFVLVARGAVAGGVAEFANLVAAAVGGGVEFEDIDGVGGADLGARLTAFAGLGGGAKFAADGVAVKRHGEDAGAMVVLPMPRWPLKM